MRTLLINNFAAIAFLALTWLIFFSRTIFGGQVYFLDDLKTIFYPLEHVYGQFQAAWQLPAWSPLFGFGQPLLAWGQLGFFTPLHVLLRWLRLHPLWLLQVSILLHYAGGLAGMYVFLRRQKLRAPAAALGAVVFVFSGFHLGHLNHVNFFTATMWLPWLLVALDYAFPKPTMRRIAWVSLAAAAMALGGQPQMVLYSLGVAVIWGLARWLTLRHWRPMLAAGAGMLLAGVLFFGLASFAILPLYEFLPNTERADALFEGELFEFSYPPFHAVTLILPTLFGDHEAYWGAKNFQELAAYVGIIPLFLTGVALTAWSRQKSLRLAALALVVTSLVFALGQYSPIYTYLVKEKILTSLAVPGRFIFLFDVGVALLAAAGLDDLLRATSRRRIAWAVVAGLALPTALLLPFLAYIQSDVKPSDRLVEMISSYSWEWLAVIGGVVALAAAVAGSRWMAWRWLAQYILLGVSSLSLIAYGWNYNPLRQAAVATAPAPFAQELRAYAAASGVPARLYAADRPLKASNLGDQLRRSDAINATFSVFQPIIAADDNLSCLHVLLESDRPPFGTIKISLAESLTATPLQTIDFAARNVPLTGRQRFCFNPIAGSAGKTYVVSIASPSQTTVRLLYQPTSIESEFAYFVRVPSPTEEQWHLSRKPAHVIIQQEYPSRIDHEGALLVRHLQATAHASSARWIGALAIQPYRDFIEVFFANDREPYDGDGLHAIHRFRSIINMAGVTHVIESVPAGAVGDLQRNGYQLVDRVISGDTTLRLFTNPEAFPKAFFVPAALFKPSADEVRHAMQIDFNPELLAYVNASAPPDLALASMQLRAQAKIKKFQPAEVEIDAQTEREAVLVLTEAATPQWRVEIDGQPANELIVNTIFRGVIVPAGEHVVTWRYESPAVARAKTLTSISLAVAAVCLLLPAQKLGLLLRGRLARTNTITGTNG